MFNLSGYPSIVGIEDVQIVPQTIRAPLAVGVPLVNPVRLVPLDQAAGRSNAADPARISLDSSGGGEAAAIPPKTGVEKFLQSPAMVGASVALVLFGGWLLYRMNRKR